MSDPRLEIPPRVATHADRESPRRSLPIEPYPALVCLAGARTGPASSGPRQTPPRAQRHSLLRWTRASTTLKRDVERARIILLSAEGLSAAAIGEKLDVERITVYEWRTRYAEGGVEALRDLPRPGPPRKLSDEKAKEILHRTTHEIAHESTHWSVRLMAKYAGVSANFGSLLILNVPLDFRQ